MTQIFFSVFNGRMVFIILFSRKNSSKEQANESNVYSVSVNPTLDEKATFAPLSSGDHGKVKWRESGKTEVERWEVMVIGTRGKNKTTLLSYYVASHTPQSCNSSCRCKHCWLARRLLTDGPDA